MERGGVGYGGLVVELCFSPPHYNIYTYLKILAMENVKVQGLSELISRDLRPSSVIFSWEILAPLTEWNCSRRVCMKHFIFFGSHYGHLIVLDGLTEMIATFSFWWSVTPYIPNRPSIFLKSEIKMLKSINVIDSNTILTTVRLLDS